MPAAHDADAGRPSDWNVTVDIVFPHHANTMGTLFGGRGLELMDVNAAIACYRYARTAVVTASVEPIDFRRPVHVGEILEERRHHAIGARVRAEILRRREHDTLEDA